ncbi:hypothetical protein NPIL_636731 [Nephila pilipes]|uniref:Uncharacterized protein n=1 Tax=Nephila pilipes TaxID=299642 RepID=A0A8X6TRF7_NEPPI|nr:hypothetical protein NPIL_636721 [Nephila pilipes]GFT43006.1 hypothetical protein NPIL_636731 [Nephila pilipes]
MPTCKSISIYKKRDWKILDTKLHIQARTHQTCGIPLSIRGVSLLSTCVDQFSKWPEAFPLVEISAEAMTKVFYTGWISRFCLPLRE